MTNQTASTPKTLAIGLDDSNGANGSNHGGIVVTATFSQYREDSLSFPLPEVKDYLSAFDWMREEGRGYRFAVIEDKALRAPAFLLSTTLPFLVNSIIESNPSLCPLTNLEIFLDGNSSRSYLSSLAEGLRKYSREVTIQGLNKHHKHTRMGESPVYVRKSGPQVLYFAGVWAHMLGCQNPQQRRKDKNYVAIPPRALQEQFTFLKSMNGNH